MPKRQQIIYTALGLAGIASAAYLRRRNVKHALGDTLHQVIGNGFTTNHPMLDMAIHEVSDAAMERLMEEEDPEHPLEGSPKVVRLKKPTQASGWHDTQVPIKDAEFTPVDPNKEAR